MILNSPYISGSITVTGNSIVSGSITVLGGLSGSSAVSASYALTASNAANAQSASNAVNAATASSADNLLVRNTLTAQTIVVQTITSSVDFVTGSTRFGSISSNTHQFTGSMSITGGLNLNAGILAVGLTPSSWASGTQAIETIAGGLYPFNISNLHVLQNAYYNGTNWAYKNSLGASRYQLNIGNHYWYTAPTGVADNPITWSQAMTLNSSGYLGIGITNPTALLHISGGLVDINKDGQSLRIFPQTSSGSARIQLQNSGSAGLAGANAIIAVESVAGGDQFSGTSPFSLAIGTATQKAFHLCANSVAIMTITGSNVGIGSTSPNRLLEVATGGDTYLRVTGNRGNADDLHVGNVEFYNSNTTRIIAEVRAITGTGGTQSNSGQLTFYTNNAGTYAERMRITSAGDIGINETSSANIYAKMQVTATSGVTFALANPSAAAAGVGSSIFFYGTTGYNTQGVIATGYDGASVTAAYMTFSTRGPSTTERMRITSGGDVGIGVTSPLSPGGSRRLLQISSGSNGAMIAMGSSTSESNNPRVFSTQYDLGLAASVTGSGTLQFYTNDVERMRINNGGALKLAVNGASVRSSTDNVPEISQADNLHCLVLSQKNASFTQNGFGAFGIAVDKAAGTDWTFAGWYSSTTSDREYQFRGDGQAYADTGWTTPASDYAEYFESADGTALPFGSTVSLVNNKIKIAEEGETVVGVIRPKDAQLFLGNNASQKWNQKYLKNDYGSYIRDAEGHKVLNPEYNPDLEYIPREKRDEWNIVGLVGQIPITKGQITNPNWVKMRDISDTVEEWLVK